MIQGMFELKFENLRWTKPHFANIILAKNKLAVT